MKKKFWGSLKKGQGHSGTELLCLSPQAPEGTASLPCSILLPGLGCSKRRGHLLSGDGFARAERERAAAGWLASAGTQRHCTERLSLVSPRPATGTARNTEKARNEGGAQGLTEATQHECPWGPVTCSAGNPGSWRNHNCYGPLPFQGILPLTYKYLPRPVNWVAPCSLQPLPPASPSDSHQEPSQASAATQVHHTSLDSLGWLPFLCKCLRLAPPGVHLTPPLWSFSPKGQGPSAAGGSGVSPASRDCPAPLWTNPSSCAPGPPPTPLTPSHARWCTGLPGLLLAQFLSAHCHWLVPLGSPAASPAHGEPAPTGPVSGGWLPLLGALTLRTFHTSFGLLRFRSCFFSSTCVVPMRGAERHLILEAEISRHHTRGLPYNFLQVTWTPLTKNATWISPQQHSPRNYFLAVESILCYINYVKRFG